MPPPGVAAPPGVAPQQPQSQNPVCARLEAQLASVDGGRGEQIGRYENAVQQQQSELDRTVAQARRTGCEGSGFFLFGRSQPPQCDELNNRIQRMRSNLDRLNADLQQLQVGRGAVEGQRRQILAALGQNDCGPQYRSAAAAPPAPAQPRGFFEALFGGGGGGGGGSAGGGMNAPFGSGDLTPSDQSSTYRTICVRTCDGFYFPVSYSAGQSRFRDDELTCQRMCPAAEVMLFTYRNPGEDVAQAVSTSGQPYTSLPNAFRYRQEFNPACSCRRQGESWAETLKSVEDQGERGDILVTDENAKTLAQPKPETRTAKQNSAKKGQPPAAEAPAMPAPVTASPLPDATPAPQAPPAAAAPAEGKRQIRTVGPPFIVR